MRKGQRCVVVTENNPLWYEGQTLTLKHKDADGWMAAFDGATGGFWWISSKDIRAI